MISAETRAYSLGITTAGAIFFPFLGRIFPVPSSAIALLFPLLAVGLLIGIRRDEIKTERLAIATVLIVAVYVLAVLASTYEVQWEFFTDYRLWLRNEEHYFEAKLLRFSLALAPAFGAALLLALMRDKLNARKGFTHGIIIVALLAFVNLIGSFAILIGTDYETAAAYFRDPYNVARHSAVSYGILFCLAVVACMTTRRFWLLSGLFIFALFLLGRRTEFVLAIGILGLFAVRSFYMSGWRLSSPAVWRPLPILALAGLLSVSLSNDVSYARWGNVEGAYQERIELVQERSVSSNTWSFWRGEGFGAFSFRDTIHDYPHNIPLETWIESGGIAAAALIALFVLGVVIPGRLSLTNVDAFAIALLTLAWITVLMKSGDAVSAARVLPLILIASTFTARSEA